MRGWLTTHWRRVAWGVSLGLVAGLYLVVKAFALHPFAGDEFIYVYQSKLVSEGVPPYSGFAAAHPPVQFMFTALVLKLFGFNFLMVRCLPILWCLAGGLGLAWLVRRECGNLASVVAMALFILSHEPLRAASHFTGVNMTTALLIFTVLAYRYRAIRLTALMAVLAVFTRLYAIPGVAVLALIAVLRDRRSGLRLVAWGGMLGVIAFVSVGIFTGFGAMVENLLLYHAQKTPMSAGSLANMTDKVLFHNATSAAAFLLSLPVLFAALARGYARDIRVTGVRRRLAKAASDRGLGLALLCLAIALVYLAMLLVMDRIWMYYFIPPIAFAAVPSAWAIAAVARGAKRLVASRGSIAVAGLTKGTVAGGATIVLLFVLSLMFAPWLEMRLGYWEENMRMSREARTNIYLVQPTILPAWLEGLARQLLWRDKRVVGEPYHTFNYVLWHESRVLDVVDEVVDTIRENTSDDAEIFGDSGTVPLFALLSGRRIAANEVDTNIQRYRSGHADPKELISKIDKSKTEMIILRHRFGVAGVREVQRLVRDKYHLLKNVRSRQGRVFLLFKRRADVKESTP